MHEELWQQVIGLDGQEASQRAKCRYLLDPDRYVIKLLNVEYVVDLSQRQIFPSQNSSDQEPASFLEQLCILAYLISARQLQLAGRLVKAESLPGGEFFFRGPHELPTQKLTKAFGENTDLLYRASANFDAERCDFGDASVELFVLPRIPLTFVIWAADEEFAPRVSILFDQTASDQLPLDALLTVVNLAVDAVVAAI